jgi:hypothetical protein
LTYRKTPLPVARLLLDKFRVSFHDRKASIQGITINGA